MNFHTIKPKSFWLMLFVALTSLVVGGIGVPLINVTGSRALHIAIFFSVLALWMIGISSMMYYFHGQAAGKYIGIKKVKLSDQVW